MPRLALLALLLGALPVAAQDVASLYVGGAEFDLSGTGSAVVVDVRARRALTSFLAVEGGLGVSRTGQQFGDVTYLLPTLELQAGPTGWRVRPYLGAGLGAFVPVSDPSERTFRTGEIEYTVDYDPATEGAVVLSLGLDGDLTDRVVARGVGRVRGTVGEGPDVFVGTFSEVAIGLGLRF